MDSMTCRQATEADVRSIADLLAPYAKAGVVLARDEDNIRHYLANFRVAERADRLVGCVAVRDFGCNLYEVRSLVVADDCKGTGIGRMLVENEIDRLGKIEEKWKLFTLTLSPGFFAKLGFREVDKGMFPEKIWCDCAKCPRLDRCDEVAMLLTPED
ncbi:MAG: GNAT family N-acetyltransferase [Victivallaceae bacterium]|nr:GNAT family N-acetyltransferase [Victivallaceae bacterium]